jgi:3D (Asp-Asp-Asp) domain-containing protein
MQHKPHHRSNYRSSAKFQQHKSYFRKESRTKRKYKQLALALAGAAILTSSVLPGTISTAQAAVPDEGANAPPVATQQEKPDANKAGANAPANYQKVIDIKATAYAPGAADNDQWGDKTYLGTQVRPGVIAVDPRVIPLGSRVFIQYPDGHGEYAVAEDTGGAIKGNRIDVAKGDRGTAKDFGIKNVKVYVISSPQKPLTRV